MKRALVWHQSRLALPIVGERVVRLIFANEGSPTVHFQREPGQEETELRFYPAQPVLLAHETGISSLEPATLLELRGAKLNEAFAYRKGDLWLAFDNGWTLAADPIPVDGSCWELTYPRPGYPQSPARDAYFKIEGYDENLLLFDDA